ncbi:helix-turn-helix transcriptional regulator [Chitinimonas sp.]|uniref:AraC family transcriptional regulator n=1 Tax=Chitinimonas sp. TaxID=1934313 RepID=UPI0035B1037E
MSLLEIKPVNQIAANERPMHQHPQGQLFTVRQGLVSVDTGSGRWVMPPGCIGWVPPGQPHGASAHGAMSGLSLYFSEDWSRAQMPRVPTVVLLTPLLRNLLAALAGTDAPQGEVLAAYLRVFADAFVRQPAQTLFLPMPRDARLAAMATALLAKPDDPTDLDGWASRIGMSRRNLTRRFAAETGCNRSQWRQQMRLQRALLRLADGASVTAVALEAGYASVSAFIAVFRRYLGASPRAYLARADN